MSDKTTHWTEYVLLDEDSLPVENTRVFATSQDEQQQVRIQIYQGEELEFIKNFIPKIDVVFLYSVCMWIKKWKKLIDFIASNSKVLFIETNGKPSEQLEQLNYCKLKFKIVKKLYDKSLDDKSQHKRKLYICKNNI